MLHANDKKLGIGMQILHLCVEQTSWLFSFPFSYLPKAQSSFRAYGRADT